MAPGGIDRSNSEGPSRTPGVGGGGAQQNGAAGNPSSESGAGGTGGAGGAGGTADGGTADGGDGGDDNTCVTLSAEAETALAPADVILAVDQSGSMNQEIDWIREGLNSFAAKVASSGVDIRVVVIAHSGGEPNALCVPAPLGSGKCPADDNPPLLTRVDRPVQSHDALQVILQEHGSYESVLREAAIKHVVVVSDDDSLLLSAGTFHGRFVEQVEPRGGRFFFHGIYAFTSPECSGRYNACCNVSASEGSQYRELVELTGGVAADLCEQNFAPVWDAVSESILESAPLECEWLIPDPPNRMVLVPDDVEVVISLDGINVEVTQVSSAQGCAGNPRAWYYDDPDLPAEVRACPALCEELQAGDEASVELRFGCKKLPPTL
jgi:hypothetical protein